MKDLLTAAPLIVILLAAAAFLFAVVMQPIFVWIICARLKATNAALRRMETLLSRPQHNALPNPVKRGA
jgi:isoprenylcysteine carboxyl methyltransferase (ICMT) family protein YpbQ